MSENEKNQEKVNETEQEEKDSTEKSSEENNIDEELEQLRLEAETARDRMLRIAADFENYKKRMEREKNEFVRYANEKFIKDLIPTIDDLERAIASTNNSNSSEAFIDGVKIIYKQLNNLLKKYNVEPIEAIDKQFDPNLHEAMMHIPSNKPENSVIEEFQKGYKLHDRIIRPSKVVVSAGQAVEEEEDE